MWELVRFSVGSQGTGYDSRVGEVFGTTGAQQAEAGRFAGMTDDEIARMTHKEGEELVKYKSGELVEGSARSADQALIDGTDPAASTEPELSPDEVKMVDENLRLRPLLRI